jgi:putative ATPase
MDLLQAQDSFQQPLADRLRPKKFEDFFDQGLISQNHSWLRQAVKAGRIPHLILWGPPGTGKTSFARLLKETPGYEFLLVNAMDLGAKEIKAVCEDAEKKKQLYQAHW